MRSLHPTRFQPLTLALTEFCVRSPQLRGAMGSARRQTCPAEARHLRHLRLAREGEPVPPERASRATREGGLVPPKRRARRRKSSVQTEYIPRSRRWEDAEEHDHEMHARCRPRCPHVVDAFDRHRTAGSYFLPRSDAGSARRMACQSTSSAGSKTVAGATYSTSIPDTPKAAITSADDGIAPE